MEREKITYLFNSGFIYEDMKNIFIFDYYLGHRDNPNIVKDYLKNSSFEKKITVFVSHAHYDHYNRDIFSWREIGVEIEYVISSDVVDALSSKDKNTTFVDRDNRDGVALASDAKVYTFGSTDIGVSFLIDTGEKIIFHSGDLNWWDWGDEDSFEESQSMEGDFKKILEDLKSFLSDKIIDTAFFPVDPRMEERAYKGALYFIDYIAPKKIIPMHFGDNFEVCTELKRLVGERKTVVANIELDGKINF